MRVLIFSIGFFLVPFFNCTKKMTPSVSPDITPTSAAKITYLALGDSYTIGESVAENMRFPNQLADSLRAAKVNIQPVRFIARTGWTTDELSAAIDVSGLTADSTFDFVTLLIGVNNQYRGRSVEAYKPEFEKLLARAVAFAGGRKSRVVVVSIPDYAFTPYGKGSAAISKGIDDYNAANAAITQAAGVAYVNITPISRQGLSDPSLVAADGLHPSGKQYGLWVAAMLPTVVKQL